MKVTLFSHTSDISSCLMAADVCVGKYGSLSKDGFNHAMSSGHDSILEHWSATFHISGVSRALTHQLVRHRVASYSQASQRYIKMDDFEYVIPKTIENASDDVYNEYISLMSAIAGTYKSFIERGIPKEDARYVLPNACTTEIVVTMNARELRHFFSLRCCTRSQWEIRELANEMRRLCIEVAPEIFKSSGPSCEILGYCREAKSCGKKPKLNELIRGCKDEDK